MTNLAPELLSALRRRYGDRPDRLAEVVAAAESWVRLRAVSDDGPSVGRRNPETLKPHRDPEPEKDWTETPEPWWQK